MASILDRYGIKEVADVQFFSINKETGKPDNLVLYLDTLKVSTIEQTADNVEARGGKGNPALISWDYNKEINVTLEDALFSAKSMAIMFGDGTVTSTADNIIRHTKKYKKGTAKADVILTTQSSKTGSTKAKDNEIKVNNSLFKISNVSVMDYQLLNALDTTNPAVSASLFSTVNGKDELNQDIYVTYTLKPDDAAVITVSNETFPGSYYIVGDTYARSDIDGTDDFFQFIIPKAKVTSENTITMEADGDPSVFNLNLRVLRPDDGQMMKLVRYTGTEPNSEATE